MFGGVGSSAATAGTVFGIGSGLLKGGVSGNAQAALGTASLANKAGAFGGASSTAGGVLGTAGGALGIYNGIQQGGISGYGGATVGALRAGAGIASLAGDSSLAGTLGSTAGYIAAPLSIYNAVENYQSGNAGADAMNDAEAGAAVGSFFGPIGTAVGAVGGAIVGGLSSLVGPGKTDAETADVKSLINATSSNGNNSQVAASVQNPYIQLAGLFDDRSSTLPMYQKYGRMGEQKFTNDFAGQINSALASGAITKNTPASQVYSQVIAPWVNSMGSGWSNVGTTYTATTQGLLQDMTAQYLNGTASQNWKAVGGDSPFSNIYQGSTISAAPAPAPVQGLYGQRPGIGTQLR